MIPDCSQLPDWVAWIAQDADGNWWGYEHEPNMSDRGWYENEVGQSLWLQKDAPNPRWKDEIHMITRKYQ